MPGVVIVPVALSVTIATLPAIVQAFTNTEAVYHPHQNRKRTALPFFFSNPSSFSTTPNESSKLAFIPDNSTLTHRFTEWLATVHNCDFDENLTTLGYSKSLNNNCARQRRGVYVTRDCKEGDVLFDLPSSTAIVIEDSETNDAARGLSFLNISKNQEWKPYWDVLPTRHSYQFDSTPDFWNLEDIYALEFPRLIRDSLARKKRIENMARDKGVSVADLQYATWIVESRAFNILHYDNDDVATNMCVLLPYLDMLNHHHEPNGEMRVMEDDNTGEIFYCVVAMEDIPAGSEVLLYYGTGNDSSDELLLHYGFVPDDNEFDLDMLEYGGEDCFEGEDEWSTTLEEDEKELLGVKEDCVKKTTLALRVRLKRAQRELSDL